MPNKLKTLPSTLITNVKGVEVLQTNHNLKAYHTMKTLKYLLLALVVTSTLASCASNAQLRHKAYKRTGGRPACVAGTGCRR
jgi:hypothetical protein